MESSTRTWDRSLRLEKTTHNEVINSLLFIIATFTLILNLLVIYITLFRRRGSAWAIDTILILKIATLDLIATLFTIVGQIVKWATQNTIVSVESSFCEFSAILFLCTLVAALASTATLSILRYLVIVRGFKVNTYFCTFISFIVVACIYTMFVVRVVLEPVSPSPSGIYCTPKPFGPDIESKIFGYVLVIVIISSSVAIPLFYTLITIHYHKLVAVINASNASSGMGRKLKRNKLIFILILSAYAIATLPEVFQLFLSATIGLYKSAIGDGIEIILLYSVTFINPLFALLLHDETKQEFIELMGLSLDKLEEFRMAKAPLSDPEP